MAASGEVSELPKSLQQIVMAFQMVPDPMARYKQLLFYATKLEPLPAELHVKEVRIHIFAHLPVLVDFNHVRSTECMSGRSCHSSAHRREHWERALILFTESTMTFSDLRTQNKVEGCVSQVWVVPELDDGGKVQWRADSDSQLTKGLAALLVKGLSGCTPEEIVKTDPGFIDMLGLSQSLTPSRNNGFLNMFRLMQKKSLELIVASGADASKVTFLFARFELLLSARRSRLLVIAAALSRTTAPHPAASLGWGGRGPRDGIPGDGRLRRRARGTVGGGHCPIQAGRSPEPCQVTTALSPALARPLAHPTVPPCAPSEPGDAQTASETASPSARRLEIVNDSHKHSHHAHLMGPEKPAGGDGTHFRIAVVSESFQGLNPVQRHRLIYGILAEEMKGPVHALVLDTKTPEEQ